MMMLLHAFRSFVDYLSFFLFADPTDASHCPMSPNRSTCCSRCRGYVELLMFVWRLLKVRLLLVVYL